MFTITLEAARVNAHLSQEDWAKKADVTRATAINWETGKTQIPASALKLLSELSNVPMDYIFVPPKANKIGREEEENVGDA